MVRNTRPTSGVADSADGETNDDFDKVPDSV